MFKYYGLYRNCIYRVCVVFLLKDEKSYTLDNKLYKDDELCNVYKK